MVMNDDVDEKWDKRYDNNFKSDNKTATETTKHYL